MSGKQQAGRRVSVLIGCTALAGSLAVLGIWLAAMQSGPDEEPVTHQVYWTLTVQNKSNQALEGVEVFSFAPMPGTWHQSLASLDANHPVEMQGGKDSRSHGRIFLEAIPPYGQRDIRMHAKVVMAGEYNNDDQSDPGGWIVPEPLIESDDGRVVHLARQLERDDAVRTIRAVYDWLTREVVYSGYDPVDRGALHALDKRVGDCTEFAALAVALARALDIPARMVNGYVVPEGGRLSPFDFHAWAEIRLDKRWLIVDAQKQRFDPSPENYLAMRYGTSRSRSVDWTRFHSPETRIAIKMQ